MKYIYKGVGASVTACTIFFGNKKRTPQYKTIF
jgi:hypothetical protein